MGNKELRNGVGGEEVTWQEQASVRAQLGLRGSAGNAIAQHETWDPLLWGEACGEAAGSSTQAGPAQQQHTRSSCHGSLPSQARGLRPTNNPSCSPGQTALRGGTRPLLHPARQGTAWHRRGNGPGAQGSHLRLRRVCVRGGVRSPAYPHFSLPNPNG